MISLCTIWVGQWCNCLFQNFWNTFFDFFTIRWESEHPKGTGFTPAPFGKEKNPTKKCICQRAKWTKKGVSDADRKRHPPKMRSFSQREKRAKRPGADAQAKRWDLTKHAEQNSALTDNNLTFSTVWDFFYKKSFFIDFIDETRLIASYKCL